MPQTILSYLCALLNAGHPFKIALLITSIQFKTPAHAIERIFYREKL